MAKKKETQEKQHVENPNVMGLHAGGAWSSPSATRWSCNYMPYAMSVIVSRAIPEIDGFKPSHRKLLYTMYKMGLLNGGRTKSANIVGATMKLNPHGDAAIYETMVRLAQGNERTADAVCRLQGQLRQGLLPGYGLRCAPVHRGQAGAHLRRSCSGILTWTRWIWSITMTRTMKEPALLPTTFPNVLVSSQHRHRRGHGQQHLRL